jgi:NAD-dependent dihydropyrimidine dehydrogenase PreA subunit
MMILSLQSYDQVNGLSLRHIVARAWARITQSSALSPPPLTDYFLVLFTSYIFTYYDILTNFDVCFLCIDIDFLQPVTGKQAKELKALCPMQVFDIEEIGSTLSATVARPRDCTMCRECIRLDGWSERVRLRRKADHFLFSVESVGCMPPENIVRDAIAILKDKAANFQQLVEEYESSL